MPDTKISAMPAVVAAASGDTYPVVQGGANKKETVDQLATWLATIGFQGTAVTVGGLVTTGGAIQLSPSGAATFANALVNINANGSASFTVSLSCGVATLFQDGSASFASGAALINNDGTASFSNANLTIDANGSLSLTNIAGSIFLATGTIIANDGTALFPSVVTVGGMLSSGDIEITNNSDVNNLIIRSPDGSRWRVTVDNAGQLGTTGPI